MRLPFALAEVRQIVAYKRDEITSDLICFDVMVGDDSDPRTWTFHEEQPEFDGFVEELSKLPGFIANWREKVVLPAFSTNETIVFSRDGVS